jgi:hypothetical protein
MKTQLEINEDLAYERRFWFAQRISWTLMSILVLASLTGLLGPGLFSKKTAGNASSFSAEYERVLRNESTATLRLSVPGKLNARDTMIRIKADTSYFDYVHVQQIMPGPERVEAGPGHIIFSFARTKPGEAFTVEFQIKPQTPRKISGTFAIAGGPAIRIKQVVLP